MRPSLNRFRKVEARVGFSLKYQQIMKPIRITFVLLAIVIAGLTTTYAQDPLPSWNEAKAK